MLVLVCSINSLIRLDLSKSSTKTVTEESRLTVGDGNLVYEVADALPTRAGVQVLEVLGEVIDRVAENPSGESPLTCAPRSWPAGNIA